jgi:ribosome maturation factor RimP
MIDRADGDEVGVEDCTIVSRTVSVLLDVADPITNPYELEVSSPGLDRPLTRAKDFQTYSGSEVRVELKDPVEGRRRYRGRLIGLEEGFIKIVVPLESVEREFALPFETIEKAKIVLTDKLLADLQRAQNKQG